MKENISGYRYSSYDLNFSHSYLLPKVIDTLNQLKTDTIEKRIFDLGCGNGSVAKYLTNFGWDVCGVDPSEEGIKQAQTHYPELNLNLGSAYDDLSKKYGQFPAVISLEVVEHVYSPRDYVRSIMNLLEPGGTGIISTPYHGYLKNLALALTGKMDNHFTALWDHGHIKFWSKKTMKSLLSESGFELINFYGAGRMPPLSKSMVVVFRKPI